MTRVSERAKRRFGGVSEEAANRAEATLLLIRSGYGVYRPEADIDGEDLLVRLPQGLYVPTQLKPRLYVDRPRYGGLGLHMLFPVGSFSQDERRPWFLVAHDPLFSEVEKRHGGTPKWTERWHNAHPSKILLSYLAPFRIRPEAELEPNADAEMISD